MKYTFLAIAAGLTLATSCSDNSWNPEETASTRGILDTRGIVPEVDYVEENISDSGQAVVKGASSREVQDLGNFVITITNSQGQVVNTWLYKDMPSQPELLAGNYTVTASSAESFEGAQWSAPFYRGSQDFVIEAKKVTKLAEPVVCKLANIRVSVRFADDLLAAADNASDLRVVVTSTPGNALTFTPATTTSGYYAAAEDLTTLSATFTGKIFGTDEDFTRLIANVAGGQHRIITYSIRNNKPAEGQMAAEDGSINVDTSVTDEDTSHNVDWEEGTLDPGDRPGQEDDTPTPPTPGDDDAVSFASSTIDMSGLNDASAYGSEGLPAQVTISAPAGLAHLVVTIISNSLSAEALQEVGLAQTFDLAYPGTLADVLGPGGFNFPTGPAVIGQQQVVFDITEFVPLLLAFPDEVHTFKVEATDQNGISAMVELKFQS